jgi:hypothetical protein
MLWASHRVTQEKSVASANPGPRYYVLPGKKNSRACVKRSAPRWKFIVHSTPRFGLKLVVRECPTISHVNMRRVCLKRLAPRSPHPTFSPSPPSAYQCSRPDHVLNRPAKYRPARTKISIVIVFPKATPVTWLSEDLTLPTAKGGSRHERKGR